MLRAATALRRMTIHAADGELGTVTEFYFDDTAWTVRYLVVRTGSWLEDREVLLTPTVIEACDWDHHEIRVSLTTDQVRHSPDVSTDRPVSRRQEIEYLRHYDQPPYWMLGTDVGSAAVALDAAMRTAAVEAEAAGAEPPTHLRSSHEVTGYRLAAEDGTIGHVRDFLINDATWRVHYLVVDTGRWWRDQRVVFAPEWVERVSWGGHCLHVRLTRSAIQTGPLYRGEDAVTPEYEAALEQHYGTSNRRAPSP